MQNLRFGDAVRFGDAAIDRHNHPLLSLLAKLVPVCAFLMLVLPAAGAQRLMVRLLNVETGSPLGHENVTILWDGGSDESTVAIGKDGLGMVEVPRGAQNFTMEVGPPSGAEPFRVPYLSCNGSDQPSISVEETGKGGVVAPNACSDKVTLAKTGEVVFWGRPVPSYRADLPKVPRIWLAQK